MRFRLGVAGALLVAAQFAAAQDQPWRSLFDGSTSKGWVEVTGKPFPTHSWTVEEGCLKALVRTDGFEDIRTVETFKSFELQFEWKLAKLGNSGVRYLIQRVDDWTNKDGHQVRARGLEYQLVDLDAPDVTDPTRITGALYSLLAPVNANWRIAVFNESRLIVHGDRVEHWLNGVRVLSYDITNPAIQSALHNFLPKDAAPETPVARESAISLQNHSSEVWFRNIKIRILP
jgi:hypothetical protein